MLLENLDDFLYFCCPECDLKDQSKSNFLQHALDQHPKANEYVTQLNSFIVKDEPYEDDHNEDINNENAYDIENDYDYMMKCEVKMETKDPLKAEDQVNKIRDNKCDQCGKEYTTKQQLKFHIQRDHEGIRHNCDFCEKTFSLGASLSAHKKKVHSDITVPTRHDIWKKNDEILKGLVEKSDLYKFSKKALNRTLIWEAITEQYNALTGNELDWKGVSGKWTKCLTKSRIAAEKEPKDSIGNEKCNICSKTISENDTLADHIKKEHPHSEFRVKKSHRNRQSPGHKPAILGTLARASNHYTMKTS